MGGDLAKPRSDAQNVDPETTMIPIQRSWAGITAGWMAAGVLSLAFTAAAGEDWWIDPAFTKVLHRSIKRFAGKAEGDYFVPQALVADEIKEGLGGPPEPAVEESGGIRLIAGGRFHSAEERAAVLLNSRQQVVLAGLIHFGCARQQGSDARPRVSCQDKPQLTVFERGSPDVASKQMLIDWALRGGA